MADWEMIMKLIIILITVLNFNDANAWSVPTAPPVKAAHFVLRSVTVEDAIYMVDMMATNHYNKVIVAVTDGVILDHTLWTPAIGAWTRSEFKTWVDYAKSKGLSVVPELKLLTHQEKTLQDNYPELMLNKVTYDPRNSKVYDLIFPVMRELIEITGCKQFLIGHDEAAGYNDDSSLKWLSKGQVIIPADLYLQDTIKLHDFLKSLNVRTMMWGDMLISTDEFPTMKAQGLHGIKPGYGKALRDKLPRDIIILDWHYSDLQKDFPSIKTFANEGFSVIGAVWDNPTTIKNFTTYADANGARGMLSTTWSYVQQEQWWKVNILFSLLPI